MSKEPSNNESLQLYEDLAELTFPTKDISVGEESILFLKELYRGFFIEELESIKHNTESPIEQMFCTGVLLVAKTRYYNLLHFTETPNYPMAKYQKDLRSCFELSDSMAELLKEQGLSWAKADQFIDEMANAGRVSDRGKTDDITERMRFFQFIYRGFGFDNAFHLTIQPQLPVSVQIMGRTIRPDLYIWLPLDESFKLIVECDGYRYHSDKTSFVADRKRDRTLKRLGYEVLRFSGFEIHKDPIGVAQELVNYLEQKRPLPPALSPLHSSNKSAYSRTNRQ